LQPYVGDTIIEGRYGNSIRLSSTQTNTSLFSKVPKWIGNTVDPILTIRNTRQGTDTGRINDFITEDFNKDDSIITLTSGQELEFTPNTSTITAANTEKINAWQQDKWGTVPSIIASSGRIAINANAKDDVIAVLAKHTQENDLVQEGLMEEPQKVLILSSDGDFIQLQKYGNVTQWSPMQKKQIKANAKELYEKKITHIVKAGDDGIPNILSKDDVFVIGERQKPVSAKRLQEFLELGYDACKNDDERRNWHRNVKLIDFDHIPEDVSAEIIDTYVNNKPTGDKMSIMNYLIEKKCRLLLDELEDF
jgi:hypothetical protein